MIDESKCDEENYLTKSQEISFTGKESKREVIDNVWSALS